MKRFNWVDYTILAIVILAVALLAWSFLGDKEEEVAVAEGGDRLSVTFLATGLDLSTAEAVVQSLQGNDLPFEGTMYPPTRIFNSDKMLDADIVAWEILEQEDGTANLLLTIEAESAFVTGSYSIGYQQIRVGKEYICKTMTMELEGIINGITVLEQL